MSKNGEIQWSSWPRKPRLMGASIIKMQPEPTWIAFSHVQDIQVVCWAFHPRFHSELYSRVHYFWRKAHFQRNVEGDGSNPLTGPSLRFLSLLEFSVPKRYPLSLRGMQKMEDNFSIQQYLWNLHLISRIIHWYQGRHTAGRQRQACCHHQDKWIHCLPRFTT